VNHTIQSDTYADDLAHMFWFETIWAEGGLTYIREDDWNTDADIPSEWLGSPMYQLRVGSKRDVDIVIGLGGGLVRVRIRPNGKVKAGVAAHDQATGAAIWGMIRDALPKRKHATDDRLDVGFWYATPNGPIRAERRITAPAWDEIADNYGAHTRAALEQSMLAFRPSHGGQIILWHGKAGTGKTWALRALCREWREWCSAEYIVDPDNAFGTNPAYLMQLLLSGSDEPPESEDEGRWKLLILEDTGELIGEQAKAEAGQGLSRLLNVADGFLGQGLRVLVLITTNEEIRKLNPAVSRPGRAASVVLFDPLTALEARTWLARHNLAGKWSPETTKTLADLYAIAEQYPRAPEESRPVGFRSAS